MYHPCYYKYKLHLYSEPKESLLKFLKTIPTNHDSFQIFQELSADDIFFDQQIDRLNVTALIKNAKTTIYLPADRYRPSIIAGCTACPVNNCKHISALIAFYASLVFPNEKPDTFNWRKWVGNLSNTHSVREPKYISGKLLLKLTKSKQAFTLRMESPRHVMNELTETEETIKRIIHEGIVLNNETGGYLLNCISSSDLPIQFRSSELTFDHDRQIQPLYEWSRTEDDLSLNVVFPPKIEFIPTVPPFIIDVDSETINRALISPRDSKILQYASDLQSIPATDARDFSLALKSAGIDFPVPDNTLKVVTEKLRPEVKVSLSGSRAKNPKPVINLNIKQSKQLHTIEQTDHDTYTRYVPDTEYQEKLIEQLKPLGIQDDLSFTPIESPSPSMLTKAKENLEKFQVDSGGNFSLVIADNYPIRVEEYAGDLDIDTVFDSTTNLVSFTPGLLVQGKRIDLQPHIANLLDDLHEGQEFSEFLEQLPPMLLIDLDSTTALHIPSTVVIPLLQFIHDYAVSRSSIRLTRYDAASLFDLEESLRQHVRGFKLDPAIRETKGFFDALRNNLPLPSASIPDTFIAPLDPYQKKGIDWLCFLSQYGFGGILADDMGAGKTRQLIGYMAIRIVQNPQTQIQFLVVCPLNPTQDWINELSAACPSMKTVLHHGPGRAKTAEELAGYHVIVTTYGTFSSDPLLKTMSFEAAVIDEAQDANNNQTDIYGDLVGLKARVVFASSRTPMENKLVELRAVFDLVIPGYLGTKALFNKHFRKPIELESCTKSLNKLRRKIGPFILRRKDGDPGVHFNIPPNDIKKVYFDLEGAHLEHYEKVRVAGHVEVLRRLKQSGVLKGSINTLPSLIEMRRICCDLSLASDFIHGTEYVNPKMDYVIDQLKSLSSKNKKAIVFTYFSESMNAISNRLDAAGINHVCIDGADTKRSRDNKKNQFRENKTDHIVATLKAMNSGANLQNAHKIIISDPWFNPQKILQAIARVHRKGLQHSIETDLLAFRNTVEIGVVKISERKITLFDAVLDGNINYLVTGGVTQDDIDLIFKSPYS